MHFNKHIFIDLLHLAQQLHVKFTFVSYKREKK